MGCTGENREEALLNCICDKIYYLHEMIEPLLTSIVNTLSTISTTVGDIHANTNTIVSLLPTIITTLVDIHINTNTIVSLLTNTDTILTHILNDIQAVISQLSQLITCCQSQSGGAIRNPVVISVNPSSTPPNRITNIAGIVPGNTYMTVEFRNVGANPVLVNGFILNVGQRRIFQVYGGDKLGPISYDCTAATGISLGGTGAGILEIEGILF